MAPNEPKKMAFLLVLTGIFAGSVSQAHASAFALIEQSTSGLGSSYAGAAATAEDASVIFYNPAGMSLLPAGMQISTGLALIQVSAKFSDSGSAQTGGNGGDAGGLSAVPNFYFATDIARDLKFGVGVSVPFGLKTEYDPTWVGRFQAIKSEILTLNVNPSVSYKLDERTSFGFGLNYQQIDAELTRAVSPLAPGVTVKVEGDDTSWGYNLGVMHRLTADTTLGVSYRSSIDYKVAGTVEFSAPIAPNGNVSVDIKMPDSVSFAVQHRLNPSWTLLADATWTGWAKIKDLTVVRDSGAVLETTPENFRNTWRVAFGAVHRYSDAWSIKMGAAYDQTPVNDTDRTARLPDQNRLWLSIGGQYRLSRGGTLDFGYAHLFFKDAPINQDPGTGIDLNGTYEGSVDILGVQYAHRF